jgi:uncharacterized membrane protein
VQSRPIDEHFLHRLEAFSDIVIALSLSEIAFNLRIPEHSSDVLAHPMHLIAFLAGFVFIVNIWWLHNRIFARCFFPDVAGIVMNFALLAAVVLFAWAQQLYYRFSLDQTTAILYATAGGMTFALVGALFLRGARDPRLHISDEERFRALWRGARTLAIGSIFLLSLVLLPLGVEAVGVGWFAIFPVAVIFRIAERRAARRELA